MQFLTKTALDKLYFSGLIVILLFAASVIVPAQSPVMSFSAEKAKSSAFLQQSASFQDSCRDIRISGSNLSARCLRERGSYVATSLEIRGITNVNGTLEYGRDGRGRSSYQETCNDIRISGANLSARCQRADGSSNYTSITLRDIVNNNGRLEYGRDGGGNGSGNGGGYYPPPSSNNPASFQDSCRNIRVATTTLSAQCRDGNGRWRDSSVQIRGITNVDGNLEYLRDGRGRSTYQETCRDIRANGSRLEARCQRADGSTKRTSVNLIGIVNDNGRLRYELN